MALDDDKQCLYVGTSNGLFRLNLKDGSTSHELTPIQLGKKKFKAYLYTIANHLRSEEHTCWEQEMPVAINGIGLAIIVNFFYDTTVFLTNLKFIRICCRTADT